MNRLKNNRGLLLVVGVLAVFALSNITKDDAPVKPTTTTTTVTSTSTLPPTTTTTQPLPPALAETL